MEPTNEDNWKLDAEGNWTEQYKDIKLRKYWSEYCEKNDVPFDLDFIFLRGNYLGQVSNSKKQWCYYFDESVVPQIEGLIHEGGISGILLSPVLTEEEERIFVYQNQLSCKMAETIFNVFHERLLIGVMTTPKSYTPFLQTPFCQEIELYRQKYGFSRNPIFYLHKYLEFYELMFQYYISSTLNLQSSLPSEENSSVKELTIF